MDFIRKFRRKYLINPTNKNNLFDLATQFATTQLDSILNVKDGPYAITTPPGYLRGIDYYDKTELPKILASALLVFFKSHKYFPNLIYPIRFNEKIVWSKFFREFKIPESGNKLLTASFIPDDLRDTLTTPEIIWHSASNNLPNNNEIEPSDYYLKSSHGCGFVHRISFPLVDDERFALEQTGGIWLQKQYGLSNGEWWYDAFQPELLLERSVASVENSISWNIFVFRDHIPFVVAYKKFSKPAESNRYDGNMNLMPIQHPETERIADSHIDKDYILSELFPLALKIGSSHNFVRVDFLIGEDRLPYLNEITFTPSDSTLVLPPELDLYLGNCWNLY